MDPLTYRRVPVNGIELEVSVTNEGGERGLALLLHGFPELAFSWRHQIAALADAGYEVWAPNLRGYAGSSRPPKVSDYGVDHLVDDVAGLIDAAGRDRVTLVGHDWGAATAWMFAIRQVRALDGLVIMNAPHPACLRRELQRFRQLRRSWYVFFFQLPWLPEKVLTMRRARGVRDAFRRAAVDESRFPDEVTDVFREAALRPGAMRAMLNYYRAVFRSAWARRHEQFPVLTTPTLMIWGLADSALTKETTDGTDELVADLTLRLLPDVSHWVQQEAPEIVNTMLLAWLDGEPVPEAHEISYDRLPDPAIAARPGGDG